MRPSLKLPTWILVWALTRALIVAQVGFWDYRGEDLEDVNTYQLWSDQLAVNHAMPIEDTWQYPPATAFLMLIPRIGGGDFGIAFVVTMLVFDLIGFALMTRLAKREGRDAGVWIWLLAMPLVFSTLVLRFDVVPTVLAIAAMLVLHQRPAWFGALAGLGAAVKVWPAFVLFAEWDRRRALRSVLAAAATIVAVFAIAWVAFGDQTGFITHQGDRGLQVEAVAATPWQLRQAVDGRPIPFVQRFGTNEIGSSLGDTTAKLLDLAAVLVLLAAAGWWLLRDRAIRAGRTELEDPVLARDFVFTVVLLFLVVSRVLSPQFMIWMVGLSAVVLSAPRTRLARPAWVVVGAIVLTAAIYQSPSNIAIRNLALLFAAVDASITMFTAVSSRPLPQASEAGARI